MMQEAGHSSGGTAKAPLSISVVIVNYNGGTSLQQCLRSIDAHLGQLAWEAVVVDNASADGSESAALAWAPRVTLIRNSTNLGFARACNQGAARTTAPFVLFLNPDAWLTTGAAGALVDELRRHERCAIVAPTVLTESGGSDRNIRGDPDMLTGFFGRSTWLTRKFPTSPLARRNVLAVPDASSGGGADVEWATGSCLLVRRSAFQEVGGFDERYFMYWEDADLCRRLRMDGWRIRYRPDARVMHAGGVSSRSNQSASIRAFHASAYLYYRTHAARSAANPMRWLAWLLLRVRCGWKIWRVARLLQ